MNNLSIKNKTAILFDLGKVLNGPTTGHWFIIPSFFNYVNEDKWRKLSNAQLQVAFSKALRYVDAQVLIEDRDQEYSHFLECYKILFDNLKELNVSMDAIKSLTYDYVYNTNKYTFFEDAKAIIPKLHKYYTLGIVSDAWPSLENVYIEAGLREYFSSFLISSQIGVQKPHPLMYQTALKDLGIQPEEAIFIDDNIGNCEGAIELGIDALLLCRDQDVYLDYKQSGKVNAIQTLNELEEILLKNI